MSRFTYEQYLKMSQDLIEDIVHERCDHRFMAAVIKANNGSFEQFLLGLLEDENYFKNKLKEEQTK